MIMTMRLFLILLLKLLIFHHGAVKVRALPENTYEMKDEIKELTFEYSNSMDDGEEDDDERATTIANIYDMPIYEANPPNQIVINSTLKTIDAPFTSTTFAPITTAHTSATAILNDTSVQDTIIFPTSSPLLMKLIAPIEPITEEIVNDKTTETFIKIKKNNKNQIKPIILLDKHSQQLIDEETQIVGGKKPRLLINSKQTSSINSDIESESYSIEDTTMTSDLDTENNETNISIGEENTTIIPSPTSSSTSKRPPKNIEIFKTRPNELLRFYVEDSHLRSPIAALVNKKSNPLNKAKKLWKAALRPNSLLDIMVVSYDSEGIKSTYNLTNTKAMMATLDKVREENATDQQSKTYYSIIRTGQLIPFDSAIFLSTDELPNDTEHQYSASMFLLKKRIRLYLIMFDDKNLSTENESNSMNAGMTASTSSSSVIQALVKETGFLGQLALLTGGDIIYVPNYVFQQNDNDGEMGYITLIRQNKLKAIDQDPVKDFHENELRNDTETLSAKEDHDSNSNN